MKELILAGALVAGLTLCFGAAAFASGVDPLLAEDKLSRLDADFVCPREYPSRAAYLKGVGAFVLKLSDIEGKVTIQQLATVRVAMLERHHCYKTLQIMRQNEANQGR